MINKETRWVLLDTAVTPGTADFTLKQIGQELIRNEVKIILIDLFKGGTEMDPNLVLKKIKDFEATDIIWNGPGAWRYWDALKRVGAKKISLWFDEPMRASDFFKVVPYIQEGANSGVSMYCWDHYWKEQMMRYWGVMSDDIELAASPYEYYTSDIHLTEDLVFIGNLHSPAQLEKTVGYLPKIFQEVSRGAKDYVMSTDVIPSWDQVIDRVTMSYSDGTQKLFREIAERNNVHLERLRWYVWALSKNEVRRRLLTEALKVHTVRIFTETIQLQHASPDEIRSILGDYSDKLKIADTSGYKSQELGQLYHYGALHLQATDPQSVLGGIPYRVYQTAASGRALFTDKKTFWENSFDLKNELICYEKENVADQINEALKDKDKLKEIGRNARKKFEEKHTWFHRVNKISNTLDFGQIVL